MVVFEESNRGQDKAIAPHSYKASGQPSNRQATGYVSTPEFAEIERMRGTGKNKLSRAQVVTKLIRIGLQLVLDNDQIALIEPRLEKTIDTKLAPLRKMEAKALKDIEELRFIVEARSSPEEINNAKKLALETIK